MCSGYSQQQVAESHRNVPLSYGLLLSSLWIITACGTGGGSWDGHCGRLSINTESWHDSQSTEASRDLVACSEGDPDGVLLLGCLTARSNPPPRPPSTPLHGGSGPDVFSRLADQSGTHIVLQDSQILQQFGVSPQ